MMVTNIDVDGEVGSFLYKSLGKFHCEELAQLDTALHGGDWKRVRTDVLLELIT